jgi:hypothetical protein
MYYDSVEKVLKLLKDPHVSEKEKAVYRRELDILDPDETIRKTIKKGEARTSLLDYQ